jgi:PPP family 3-phenylpropionic acid transporter
LSAKLFYLCYFGALGAIAPFFNIYLERTGLSGSQIGWLGSVPPLVGLIANPFWGAVVDRWQAQRLVLLIGTIVGGAVSLLFLWTNNFWLLGLLVLLLVFFRNPMSSMVDSVVVSLASKEGTSYGRQRLWGSIGFILTSYGLAQFLQISNLDMIFWLHALLLGLFCAFFSWFLPATASGGRVDLLGGVRTLLGQRSYLTFLLAMILFGAGASCFIGFLGLQILALGGSERQVGLAYALNPVGEVPVMYFGAVWVARVSSRRLLLTGLSGFTIVWSIAAWATTPLYLLLVTPLIGVCFGLTWMAAVDYANSAAPAGLRATAQALMGAVQSGIGWSVGSLLAGYLWEFADGRTLFAVAGVIGLSAALFFYWGGRQRRLIT